MSEKLKTPQDLIGDFWSQFVTKKPGKVTAIFPNSLYTTLLPKPSAPDSAASHTNFGASYEAVAADCRAKVARIVRDCRRTNAKFTDPDFDLRGNKWYCLLGLMWNSPTSRASASDIENALSSLKTNQLLADPSTLAVSTDALLKVLGGAPVDDDDAGNSEGDKFDPEPGSVHRVDWIYEDPRFELDGYSSSDIIQGGSGDCWWLSAVATIAHRADLMDKICVARDEECGVYGFVFYRDGCWISTVIDDSLCLKEPDFSVHMGSDMHDPGNSAMTKWRRQKQTGSEALYFAACRDPNETWLPLLEKAYAKVHGDYNAICGGWVGEGVEDLTGGVNSEMVLEDVLSKKHLWTELLNDDKHFVFGLDILDQGGVTVKNGLANAHAYSLLEAREETGEDGKIVKLVKIRNPWGRKGGDGSGEWNGPWSDGSKEWTPYWLTKLDYCFENDGVFWMTYTDMLSTFTNLYRTRLFDDSWTVTQQWTGVNVAWLTGYLQKKFVVEVKEAGTVVLVLQQLDSRYFHGLEGEYTFLLHFILQKKDSEPGDYVCRVRPKTEDFFRDNRSVSCEIDLEPGVYEVLPKITARKSGKSTVESVVALLADAAPQKLRQVGLSFDLAHAKALKSDLAREQEAEERKKKKAEEKKEEEAAKAKAEEEKKVAEKAAKGNDKKKPAKDKKEEKTEGDKPKKENAEGDEEKQKAPEGEEAKAEDEEDEEESDEDEEEEGEVDGTAAKADEKPKKESASGEHSSDGEDSDDSHTEGHPDADEKGSTAGDAEEGEDSGETAGGPDDEFVPEDGSGASWNAVCVIGLRVYSQDSSLTITLADPKNAEEASSVAVNP